MLQPLFDDPPGPVAQRGDQGVLFGHVRHDPFRRVRRSGRADVGDEVEQGRVLLVADGGYHRGVRRGHGAYQRLVGEGQQVLHRPTAPGDDDDVHAGDTVEVTQRVDDLPDGERPLDRHFPGHDAHGGPATAGVLDHVPLGRARPSGDQPDRLREEREPAFAGSGEQALRREHAAQLLEAREQGARTEWADLHDSERQRSPRGVEGRLAPDHHSGAIDEPGSDRLTDGPRAGEPQRHVGDGIAQREEDGGEPRAADDLGELPFHPDPPKPVDPVPDRAGNRADRQRLLR